MHNHCVKHLSLYIHYFFEEYFTRSYVYTFCFVTCSPPYRHEILGKNTEEPNIQLMIISNSVLYFCFFGSEKKLWNVNLDTM